MKNLPAVEAETPLMELERTKQELLSSFLAGKDVGAFQDRQTEILDQYFRRSLQESEAGRVLFRRKTPYAFVAVGGYGRKELCVRSDVDILILFGSKVPEEAKGLAQETLFPLWDLGLDLGYGIRSVKECVSLSKEDFQVLTSLMDARFVCGDSPLFLSLMEQIQKKILKKKGADLARWLEDRGKMRSQQFGDASYLLEPHLKEGIGGLRDYHQILWLARVLFDIRTPRDLEYLGELSHSEYRGLSEDLAFIWLIRNHLHQLSGRKNDRLDFEHQEKIAKRLGFRTENDLLDVEQFLGRLHTSMASIKALNRSFVRNHLSTRPSIPQERRAELPEGLCLHQGQICFDSATSILSQPLLLMRAFEEGARLGVPLSIEAIRLVKEFLFLVDDAFRSSERAVQGFLDVLGGPLHASEALDQMYETRFLETFVPELGKVRDRVQFDAYHVFPVGRHLLETVRHLKGLGQEKDLILADVFLELERPEILLLAGLFHDVGKTGRGHARKGAAVARTILNRFGYEKGRTEEVLFLVRNHILLAETATRRDLNDEKAVTQCARDIGSLERLKMLYLLTWADSKATGPRAWNDWVANLVQELFFKVFHILDGGELASPNASRKVKRTKSKVRQALREAIEPLELEALFDAMPPRYLLNTSPAEIVRHLRVVHPLRERLRKEGPAVFDLEAKENESGAHWEVAFFAKDRPGLFSDVAGALALNNINILSAHIYTWTDGTAVDLFKVSSPLDPFHSAELWEKIKRDIKRTFTGKLSLDFRLGKKSAPSILSSGKRPSKPPEVRVDNRSSDFFTLIEVFSDDRVGLLYLITHTLFNLKLDIHIAKIATKGDQIADVFYVRDLLGQKVEDEEQVEEIKRALLYRLKD